MTWTQDQLKEKSDWIIRTIDESLDLIGRKRRRFQRIASSNKIIIVLFSTASTICLGVRIEGLENELKMIAFILGAFVSLLATIEPYFNFRSLWIEHEEAKYLLHRLKNNVGYYMAGISHGEIDINELQKFQEEHQKIWDSLSTNWLSHRRTSEKNCEVPKIEKSKSGS